MARLDISHRGALDQSTTELPLWKRVFDWAVILLLAPGLLLLGGPVALLVARI